MSLPGTLARWLSRPLESADEGGEAADAAIVLGAPIRVDGGLTPVVEERVRAGVDLWRRGLAPVICFSGGLGPHARGTVPEAVAMAEAARELGVPEAALRVEAGSPNTRENALRCAEMLLGEGLRRVWIVTQPFHLRRALFWFRRAGFEARGWRIADSLQYADPVRGLKWIAREYGAWVRLGAWEIWMRARR